MVHLNESCSFNIIVLERLFAGYWFGGGYMDLVQRANGRSLVLTENREPRVCGRRGAGLNVDDTCRKVAY